MRLLLFGGTSDSRRLIDALMTRTVHLTVSVATQYGRSLLPAGVSVLEGRRSAEEMRAVMGGFDLVIDAVHPYATEATTNIRTAAEGAGLPLLRLGRECAALPASAQLCSSTEDAAAYLLTTTGNILLTTGANSLETFTRLPDFFERLYVRVLPAAESIAACLRLGILQSHILAMQGPFSSDMNSALMRHWSIQILVTKESGNAGGFSQKVEACKSLGARLVVIERPNKDDALTLDEILREIDCRLEGMP